MQHIFEIDCDRKTPKYLQIVNSVTNSIKYGKLKKGDKILSINELSNEFFLSRDTVQKAYKLLEGTHIIVPVKGKGFYINRTDVVKHHRVLLLFNKMSNYKKQVYNSFVQEMGDQATIDLKIYHCDTDMFLNILRTHLHEYDYYIIMPHFYEREQDAYKAIAEIPEDQLLILDKEVAHTRPGYAAVYQDFKNDIVAALESAVDLLKKYDKLILVFPTAIPYPYEILVGFRNFCMQYEFPFGIKNEICTDADPKAKEAYIVIEETDLVNLIKRCRCKNLEIGKDVGIISYNDTPLKEILLDGITVISTDHARMGADAARLILENRKEKIKNPFSLIVRKSL
jgi:DNA-binding transcriptional regulator YhcF (GntR family)